MNIVRMVVMMLIECQAIAHRFAEQLQISRMPTYTLRMSDTADVSIEAEDPVGGSHHQMQIVRNHQHPAAVAAANTADEAIELRLSGNVDPLHRLIQHQQIGAAQQRACQQHPLLFASGKHLHRIIKQVNNAQFPSRRRDTVVACRSCEPQKTRHRQRQILRQLQSLRHITDCESTFSLHPPRSGLEQPENNPHQRSFAGAVGTDQSDNLTGMQRQIHAFQHLTPAEPDPDAGRTNQ